MPSTIDYHTCAPCSDRTRVVAAEVMWAGVAGAHCSKPLGRRATNKLASRRPRPTSLEAGAQRARVAEMICFHITWVSPDARSSAMRLKHLTKRSLVIRMLCCASLRKRIIRTTRVVLQASRVYCECMCFETSASIFHIGTQRQWIATKCLRSMRNMFETCATAHVEINVWNFLRLKSSPCLNCLRRSLAWRNLLLLLLPRVSWMLWTPSCWRQTRKNPSAHCVGRCSSVRKHFRASTCSAKAVWNAPSKLLGMTFASAAPCVGISYAESKWSRTVLSSTSSPTACMCP